MIERRTIFEKSDIEVREVDNGNSVIEGHAAVFDSEYYNEWWNEVEIIKQGAFKRTIKNGTDVVVLFNHDPNFPLGRRSSGTLKELREDDIGLYYKVEVENDIDWAQDVVRSIKRKDINGNSFGFIVKKENRVSSDDEDEPDRREILEVELIDVGPVTFPAYTETDVQARSDLFQRAKAKTGIEIVELAKLLTRSERNQPLSDADREKIENINNQINEFIKEDPAQGSHSSDLHIRKLKLKNDFEELTL